MTALCLVLLAVVRHLQDARDDPFAFRVIECSLDHTALLGDQAFVVEDLRNIASVFVSSVECWISVLFVNVQVVSDMSVDGPGNKSGDAFDLMCLPNTVHGTDGAVVIHKSQRVIVEEHGGAIVVKVVAVMCFHLVPKD